MEHKALKLEVKAEEEGVISGYGSVFDVLDGHGDMIKPGAFTESLAERMPKMLWQHDMWEPIGTWIEVREDGKGLYVKGKIATATGRGRDAYELAKFGAMDGLSIGYRTREYEMHGNNRVLEKVDLYEVSMVTIAANSEAMIDSVKSGDVTERDIEALLRANGFSRSQAKAFVADGFDGYRQNLRDAGKSGPEPTLRDAGAILELITREIHQAVKGT